MVSCPWDDPVRPPVWPDRRQERIEYVLDRYERMLSRQAWLDDDALPYLDLLTGTEIFAEAFGCGVHRPAGDMPFAQPLVVDPSDVAKLRVPRLEDSTLAFQFELADEARRRAGADTLLRLPDIQSPMDIAALIWDKNTLYIAMLESPQAVSDLATMACELLTGFMDEWHARYGDAFIAHYPDYYMPGGITLSEDECGIVSPEMFEVFFLPHLVELAEHFGEIGIHCCADAMHQWDQFKRVPNLKLINLVKEPDYLRQAWTAFETHCVQMHNWCGDGPCGTWARAYPSSARMVITVGSDSRDDAKRKAELLRASCARC